MLLQLLSMDRAVSKTLTFAVIESSLAGRRFQVSSECVDLQSGPIIWHTFCTLYNFIKY